MSAIPPLFAGLCDDAALFPPGNAPLGDAVPAHAAHVAAWYGGVVGPFVVADRHLSALAERLHADPAAEPLPVALVVPGGADLVPPALRAVAAAGSLALAAVEVALAAGDSVASARTALEALPRGATGYVEVPLDDGFPEAVAGLADGAGERLRLKLRTGGTTASAFPSEQRLADALVTAARLGLALKCTAGLHEAVRHTDPATGFEHHGFLNLLLAVDAAARGDVAATCAMLAERDGEVLAAAVRALTPAAVDGIRSRFASYGTCSITEPVDELVRLRLLEAPTAGEGAA